MRFLYNEPQCACEGVFYKYENKVCRSVFDMKFNNAGERILIILKNPRILDINVFGNEIVERKFELTEKYGDRYSYGEDDKEYLEPVFKTIISQIHRLNDECGKNISVCRILNAYDYNFNNKSEVIKMLSIFDKKRERELEYYINSFERIILAIGKNSITDAVTENVVNYLNEKKRNGSIKKIEKYADGKDDNILDNGDLKEDGTYENLARKKVDFVYETIKNVLTD